MSFFLLARDPESVLHLLSDCAFATKQDALARYSLTAGPLVDGYGEHERF
jgi:hypothetical protein